MRRWPEATTPTERAVHRRPRISNQHFPGKAPPVAARLPEPPGNALLMGAICVLFVLAPPGRFLGIDTALQGRLLGLSLEAHQ